jgi:hypothetical protein
MEWPTGRVLQSIVALIITKRYVANVSRSPCKVTKSLSKIGRGVKI